MSKSDSEKEAEVIEVEQKWVKAHLELDVATLEDMLAEDFIKIQSDGSLAGKSETIDSYRSNERFWDKAVSDQYQLKIIGDVAILIGRWQGRGKNNGEHFDYQARFMTIYVKCDGKWQILAEQSTSFK